MSVKEITAGQDSFLDIIANLVGVLIILVVLVGAQAKKSWIPTSEDPPPSAELTELQSQIAQADTQVKNRQLENKEIEQRAAQEVTAVLQLTEQRHRMLVQTKIVEQQLEKQKQEQRKKLDERQRAALAQHEKRVQLESQLAAIRAEGDAVSASQPKKEIIEHYPNPIAKTVFSDEIHFHLKEGRIAYVPFDGLIHKMKSEWEVKAEKLRTAHHTLETVGPIGNFRLQYELQSETIPARHGGRARQAVRFDRFTIIPMNHHLGDPISDALAPGSEFRTVLDRFTPGKTTVSIWVYPDSFAEYNQVKNWLYSKGYQVACWPLDQGERISGGPNGFRTSAQ